MPHYHVKVSAVGAEGEEFDLGSTILTTQTKKEAASQGIQDFWDPRLDAADCSAKAVVTRSAFDRFQRFALDRYNDGSGSYITKKGELREYMDGLLGFLVIELSEHEGCDNVEEALHRLGVAARQLEELSEAFASDFQEVPA